MGAIRLLLALAVVFGHASAFGIIPPYTAQLGYFPVDATLAVQMFFVVSGFYMGLALSEKYRKLDGWVGRFYASRYLRLMPTYLVAVALVSLINPIVLHPPSGLAGAALAFSSVTLLGQELAAFYTVGGVSAHGLTPINQAWSLGVEIEFYLIVPALILLRTRTLVWLTLAALGAKLMTAGMDGYVQQRAFPLALFFFLLGMLSHRFYRRFPNQSAMGYAALAVVVFLAAFGGHVGAHAWKPDSAIVCAVVLAAAIPPVFALTRDWTIDRIIGELSYPVYIIHIAVGQFFVPSRSSVWMFMLSALAAAVPLLVLVELPMAKLRMWLLTYRRARPVTACHTLAVPQL